MENEIDVFEVVKKTQRRQFVETIREVMRNTTGREREKLMERLGLAQLSRETTIIVET